ncbi:hypothetical protein [Pseudoalteromonas piscicida]
MLVMLKNARLNNQVVKFSFANKVSTYSKMVRRFSTMSIKS